MKKHIKLEPNQSRIDVYKINYSYGGSVPEQSNLNSPLYDFQHFIDKEFTDHWYIEKEFTFNNKEFHIISLNIPQRNSLRTMVIFDKVQGFIRSKKFFQNMFEDDKRIHLDFIKDQKNNLAEELGELEKLIKSMFNQQDKQKQKNEDSDMFAKHFLYCFKNNLLDITKDIRFDILSKNLKKKDGSPVSKIIENLTDEKKTNIINEINKILEEIRKPFIDKYKDQYPNLEIHLRIATNNGILYSELDENYLNGLIDQGKINNEDKQNILNFKEKYPNDLYFDLFWEREDEKDYENRLKEITNFILKKRKEDENFILCLQEINPATLNLFKPEESAQIKPEETPLIKKLKLIGKQPYEKNTHSLLFSNYNDITNETFPDSKTTPVSLNTPVSENDAKILDLLKGNKKPQQNIKYKLKVNGEELILYNIHTPMYVNEIGYNILYNILETSKNKMNFIIVGDMNLKLNSVWKYKLAKLFQEKKVYHYFLNTPEIEYNIQNREDTTNDVFISKGIQIKY